MIRSLHSCSTIETEAFETSNLWQFAWHLLEALEFTTINSAPYNAAMSAMALEQWHRILATCGNPKKHRGPAQKSVKNMGKTNHSYFRIVKGHCYSVFSRTQVIRFVVFLFLPRKRSRKIVHGSQLKVV